MRRGLGLLAALLLPLAAPRAQEVRFPFDPSFAATGSNFGRVGLLEMPNARFRPDGTIETGVALRNQRDFWFVNFQALPFLETTFRLSERLDGTLGRGTTTDRAFDVKLRLWDEGEYRPALAIGLQDLIGTGIYQGEYIVASKRFWGFDVSAGIGWGRLGTTETLPNPLGRLGERFTQRQRSVGQGGTVALGSLFTGARTGFFAGIEWSVPEIATPFGPIEGLRLKVEYSSDALRDERGGYPARRTGLRGEAASPVNVGLQWQPNRHLDIGLSWVHGTDLLFRASLRLDPENPPADLPRRAPPPLLGRPGEAVVAAPPPVPPGLRERVMAGLFGGAGTTIPLGPQLATQAPAPEPDARARNAAVARRLFPALRAAGFAPIAVAIEGEEARITVSGGPFRTLAQALARAVRAAQPFLPREVERIRLTWERDGAVIARVVTLRAAFEALARGQGSAEEIFAASTLLPAAREEDRDAFTSSRVNFAWDVEPRLGILVGDRDAAVRWQAGIAIGGRLDLPGGIGLAGSVYQRIAGNLQDGLPSDSVLPRVRSDFARYAREGTTTIPALYAEGVWNIAPDVFARATIGYLEPMFAGVSAEVLWRPVNQRFAVGLDVNHVVQRQYDGLFGTLGYNVTTGHLSLYADLPLWNLYTVLRGGRYLAGDWGGTIEFGRRFDSGITVGGFATFTNVSYRDFGEGSFDKGIFVRIPFDFFGVETRSQAVANIRPVQRDGGQRLVVDNPLWEATQPGRAVDFARGFMGLGR
ncbi:MAG: YjbH domain-containing protein [Rubritepida sp.]|nr:YjbH domain-containing protein [Rubritepida sp.]